MTACLKTYFCICEWICEQANVFVKFFHMKLFNIFSGIFYIFRYISRNKIFNIKNLSIFLSKKNTRVQVENKINFVVFLCLSMWVYLCTKYLLSWGVKKHQTHKGVVKNFKIFLCRNLNINNFPFNALLIKRETEKLFLSLEKA